MAKLQYTEQGRLVNLSGGFGLLIDATAHSGRLGLLTDAPAHSQRPPESIKENVN